eukprot:gb/GEZN01007564.1/.p1 GENE.gb/GEZN01007564.1/~~gb/GEZN01007564.1/.p1  ORF type:complete len:402 (+),score=52.85 gb/GEZN01007564.1/:47-1252(+)
MACSLGRFLRGFASQASSTGAKPKTAVVMLNMGGPRNEAEVGPFLKRLFQDGEIITLGPLQNTLGPFLAWRRTPKIEKQYGKIGGSPIAKWTDLQGQAMCRKLDALSPATAPHKHYIAFRYANPLTEEALVQMKEDGVERAVAFSQYPQHSCTTTGSSLNQLWRECKRMGLHDRFVWSVIDRWPIHSTFIAAVVGRIHEGLAKFPDERSKREAVIVFSAHSLPLKVVERGDQYQQEVGATCQQVMQHLGGSHQYILAWQSKVGPLPWIGPKTGEVLHNLGKRHHKDVLIVPIAFTCDHVETLYEIDVEYKEDAKKAGITNFIRAPSLNDSDILTTAQAEIVAAHLAKNVPNETRQFDLRCHGCINPDICRTVLNPVGERQGPSPVYAGPGGDRPRSDQLQA